jgi:hypothetical protein
VGLVMLYEVCNYNNHGFFVFRYGQNQEENRIINNEGHYLLKNGSWNHGTNYADTKNNGYYNSYRWAVQALKAKCGNVKVIKGREIQ